MHPLLDQLHHAIEAQPDTSRIEAVEPILRSALSLLLNMEIDAASVPRQCPRCGTDEAPAVESVTGCLPYDEYKYRHICAGRCGHCTPWIADEGQSLEAFYQCS